MPKSALYSVNWSPQQATYLFSGPEQQASLPSLEEGGDWLRWLETHHAFAFQGRAGQINLLKEKRKRGDAGYWYAYRRHAGQMVKCYVGRSTHVSIERLEEIALQLSREHESEHQRNSPAPSVSELDNSVSPQAGAVPFEPLLMPKLQLPRLQKSLLPREQLLDLLDRGLEHKVTLITGPAGYGKTTLVGQWIAARSAGPAFPRIASVTLDEGDNDPIRFWRYIIAACQQWQPGFGTEALELLRAHRLPPFKPLEMMLTALLNELSQLERPGILILDDLHVITSPPVAETLSFFLDHLPFSLHLVLLVRGDPHFSVARLRARNELLDIFPPHLSFSLDEARTFFEQELPFSLSPSLLRQMHERLEGWPAGLRLFVRALRWYPSEGEIERVFASFSGSYVIDIREYFLSEVLHALPAEQQDFLLQTSILPRLTAALCDAVSGREDSVRLLEALRAGDLFLVPLDGIGQWSRYHSLFAEAMQQEARRRLGDERLRQLAARASIWYEQQGFLADAIETALNAAAFQRAASLIENLLVRNQQSSPTFTEIYNLKRWAERLPQEELEHHPDLCVHYAMTLLFILMERPYFPSGKEHIHQLLQAAEQRWRDANKTEKLAEVFAFRALLARLDGHILQSVTWARQALAWLPQQDPTWRGIALTSVGIGEILDGKLEQAHAAFVEALALNEQLGNLSYVRAIRNMLGWASIEQGALRHTAEQFRQVQAEARVQEDHDDVARTQLELSRIAYQWNHLEEAEQAAQEALSIGEQIHEEELQAHASARLAYIEHARGQSAQAQQRLSTWLTQSQPPTSPYGYQFRREVQAALARIQLASGDLTAVERWFATIERREEMIPLLQRQREHLLHARLRLSQGESAAAIETLEGLGAAARATGHLFLQMESQVVLVLAYARQGLQAKVRELLCALLGAACSEGYMRLFLDEGEELADLLRVLLPSLHEKAVLGYARHLLSAFALQTSAPAPQTTPAAASLLAPLSLQEQKVLRLLAAGNANAQIARELVVSVNTVRTQVRSIYRKLNVTNRVEASAAARQLALL
ncbi:MAG TPA: LuxR C-terminal-related transcriptional regulator [Ktedonobacterales bacterium]|nr:LuxR C-terminal-related transcriptional regulator [Ktedonobacterales bacterium]